jgi:uroporphyrinogen-III decarboxylase
VAWKDRIGDDGIVLFGFGDAICVPAGYFSPEDFSLLWVDAPDAFMALIDAANERLLEQADLWCKAGVDAFRFLGGEYASTQLGPSAYEVTVTRPDRQVTDLMHSHGAVVYYHNHGPTMKFLELLAGVGMDACDCFEAPPWGDCDLREARARIGDRVCLVGNLDDMEVIDKLPEEAVCAIARERLEAAGQTGFVLGGTASGTYTDAGARNFIAMARLAAEMG